MLYFGGKGAMKPKNVFTISLGPRWGALGMSWLPWTAFA